MMEDRVKTVRIILQIEIALCGIILLALIVSGILTAFSIEEFVSIFTRLRESADPLYPVDNGAAYAITLTMVYTMWAAMLIFQCITFFILRTGLSRQTGRWLIVWVIFQSILVTLGLIFFSISGAFMKSVWWWWILVTLGYIYRIYSIHVIRMHSKYLAKKQQYKTSHIVGTTIE